MDAGRVIEALRGTLVSDKQAESTKTLDEMHKIIGFTPTLLNIVLEVGLEVSVRQAAALYLKNNVSTWWKDPNKNKPLDPLFFNIHEQDRQAVRNAIVGAVVAAPLPLQAQLKIALSKIISCDYPSRFAEFPGQLKHFLSSADHNQWHGALVCLYAFVKVYEHERNDESKNTAVPMREFLPILQAALSNLINDKSEESRILQVLILKIFYAYTYCHFPLDVMSKENQLEPFLLNHVIPTLHAAEGYRRARAYWLVGKLADATFTDQNVFAQLVEEIRKSIFSDPELPVRALAALCLKDLLHTQEEAKKILVPHLRELILQILELLRQTEFDDLNQVIERLMTSFEKELVPIAVELTQNMCATFMRLIQSVENGASEETNERGDEDLDDYRAVVATSVLDNIEAMLRIAEEHGDLVAQLEPIVALQIKTIFDRELSIFYEEALSLLFSLTTTKISPLMWQLFDQLYIVFQKDSSDCFSEMMPCLHNYMTVDRSAFIADPKHVEVIAAVCSQVLQSDEDETAQMYAAKLLEVLLIDYRGQINQYAPKFIELALTRLTKPIVASELRVMCLQVVVAGILYCPSDVLAMMTEHQWPGTATPILAEFLKVWISDADVFLGLHDRRVYVLGLCLLLSLPAAQRPSVVEAFGKDYIPTLLVLFNGLKRAYAAKAQNQAESDDEEEEESDEEDIEEKALGSDEDEVDEEGASYLEMLEGESDGSVDDDDDEIDEETTLEAFDTEMDKSDCDMDEYVTFYRVMTELESGDPNWYNQLIGHLTEPQQKELKEVVNTALKCMQQKESKMIEQAGGYSFTPTIPSSFNFGANPGNQ
ncbi:Ran-binding protein 7 [Fasciola hepatica]|uniref:Ran-binding protein 7 n=1 Tax=Fasciola hepatica TaxID=6192 RepID=A0A4E0RBY1_FASHE|nr:Ran-binding protein 7 [Fasciola hepatica]